MYITSYYIIPILKEVFTYEHLLVYPYKYVTCDQTTSRSGANQSQKSLT